MTQHECARIGCTRLTSEQDGRMIYRVYDAQPVDGGLFLLELAENATEPGANARSKPKGPGYRVHVCPSTAGP